MAVQKEHLAIDPLWYKQAPLYLVLMLTVLVQVSTAATYQAILRLDMVAGAGGHTARLNRLPVDL